MAGVIAKAEAAATLKSGLVEITGGFPAGHFRNSLSEPFPGCTLRISLFVSRLRGRAVRQTSHDSMSLGRFALRSRFPESVAVNPGAMMGCL